MIRNIVYIDEEKCDGCGLCVPACDEGAIQIIDGKAKLVSEVYCDGLGACLGECPNDAITIEEREAEEFNEKAVEHHLAHLEGRAYEEAPAHLALGDIAVAPKLSATEGAGKILNYMAMGLPTVAFDTPVSREYMGRLGVYAGQTGDPAALADAIASLLDDSQRRTELGHKLRARVARHFSWERAGRHLLAVYRTVLAQKT